jgi:hypothetical protein
LKLSMRVRYEQTGRRGLERACIVAEVLLGKFRLLLSEKWGVVRVQSLGRRRSRRLSEEHAGFL